MTKHKDAGDALRIQRHQQTAAQDKLSEISHGIDHLHELKKDNLSLFEDLSSRLDALMESQGIEFDCKNQDIKEQAKELLRVDEEAIKESSKQIDLLEVVSVADHMDWNEYILSVQSYAERNGIDLSIDPFSHLMTDSQLAAIERRIDEDFTFKNARCDQYDYMIAATCGLIVGLVDIFLIGLPGQGPIGHATDKVVDGAVINVAKMLGWSGPREGSDPTSSAIGFLERKFPVNYDQSHSNAKGRVGTGGMVRNLTPSNHHVKSLAHSPDLVGLLFSIVNQFTNTSTFVSAGELITINTETFELHGSNFVAKVFSGFSNWLGHLTSDVAGSSGAQRRGSGIPIPFYSLLQFLDFGSFGQHRDTFAKVAVKVFEQGYDLRHGLAMAVPVLMVELMTRLAYTFKQRIYHHKGWDQCIPSASNAELRRMLLVAHGSLCLADSIDAGIRSGGNIVLFMLRSNLVAWARFGSLAMKEVMAWHRAGALDIDAVNGYLDAEYRRLLVSRA